MRITVVIPAYNESTVIASVVTAVLSYGYRVVVVDDGSVDATGREASNTGATVLRHAINRGQGAALQTGITYALTSGADVVVTFDADGQFRAEEISRVVAPLISHEVDVVLGSRFLNLHTAMPASRRALLRAAVWITKLYTGLLITDTHNGFRAFTKSAAAVMDIRQDGMAHASEILELVRKHQLRHKEVPVTVIYSDYSLAKGQRLSNSFRIMFDLLLSRIAK